MTVDPIVMQAWKSLFETGKSFESKETKSKGMAPYDLDVDVTAKAETGKPPMNQL